MRRKIILFITLVIILISITSCKADDKVDIIGLNAKIVQISQNIKGFVVQVLDDERIGDYVYVNCNAEDIAFLYVDYETQELAEINYSDFIIGDEIKITATIYKEDIKNKNIYASQIQLGTQRLNEIFD
jgi:hypothetical protein